MSDRAQPVLVPAPGSRLRRRAVRSGDWARGQRGLTLIEILVVLFIVALIMWSASLSMGAASQAEVVRSTNQLAATVRFAYDRARFSGQHHRIHIDFDRRTFQLQVAEDSMYLLPPTNRQGELAAVDLDREAERADRDERAAEAYFAAAVSAVFNTEDPLDPYAVNRREVPRQRPPLFEAFEPDGTLGQLGKPIELPEGVEIYSVHTDAEPDPITEGEAAIYFFPGGRTQMAHIQLKGRPKLRQRIVGEEDVEYTIILEPLTGKVRVEPGLVELELPTVLDELEDDLGDERERRSF